MKISTNFVRPAQRAVIPIAAMMWVAAFAMTTGAIWLMYDAAGLRGELPQLRTRLERLGEGKNLVSEKGATPAPLPPARELAETRERVAKINAAAKTRGLPTLALLTELEKLLPAEAWLTTLHHRATEGEVVLVAAAANSDPLSTFLLKLENSPLFEDAMLLREVQPGGSRTNVEFEIRLKVRP